MKLGARILKTGIAITLSLLLAELLQLPSPIFAAIAAVFAIQPSIYRSYLSILEQIQANVIGAFLAVVFGLAFGNHPFIIGLTAVIVIAINLKLGIGNTIGLALVTVIAIMENPGADFIQFALIRFGTIILGVLSAFIVNLIFLPPKYETKLYYKVVGTTEEIIKWIRMSIRHASEHTLLKDDIEKIKEKVSRMELLFSFYKEERTHSKKKRYVKSRKLVLFRQLILTTSRALVTLKLLHRLENDIHHTKESFQELLNAELECLLSYHEQVMLKFVGKIKSNPATMITNEVCSGRRALIDAFMNYKLYEDDKQNKMVYHLFPLVSSIIEYSEELEHLDKLIDSFHNYHKEDNEFDIQEQREIE
ncbi:aromatic acid exporter family protein [Bacillus sp. CGMCC 1.16541]|uniref:FUSC family protein n=1 Tax=Bacillus sp. CGMCC 1.16541 TaxID=2185143 RepID=UPI000D72580C|nr:aromatic acid exporter family protein [Bacillus sp. CGMCC 1.16541]